MINTIIIIAALIALAYGTFSDIKTREIPDWANYGLLIFAMAFRLVYSILKWDFSFILEGAIGFGAMFLFALLMFYTGQWGGGDSKFIMGFGALLGINYRAVPNSHLFVFLINSLVAGAVFSIIWSVVLAIKNKAKFVGEICLLRARHRKARLFFVVFLGVAVIASLFMRVLAVKMLLFLFFSVGILTFHLWLFIKAVENSCMIRKVGIEKLTEGDWIVDDVKVKGKYVTGPKELGISLEQIAELKKLKKQKKIGKNFKISVKYGIPFLPSFLIGYLMVLLLGNWLLALV